MSRYSRITSDPIVPCVVNGDNTIDLETAQGNEIDNSSDGTVDLRSLDP